MLLHQLLLEKRINYGIDEESLLAENQIRSSNR